jgi:hypothetical protein
MKPLDRYSRVRDTKCFHSRPHEKILLVSLKTDNDGQSCFREAMSAIMKNLVLRRSRNASSGQGQRVEALSTS